MRQRLIEHGCIEALLNHAQQLATQLADQVAVSPAACCS